MMWIRTNNNLINIDRVQNFESCTRPNKTEFVYANFVGCEDHGERELVCVCHPEEVQPLLDAIARALGNNVRVFDLQEWLDSRHQDKEA